MTEPARPLPQWAWLLWVLGAGGALHGLARAWTGATPARWAEWIGYGVASVAAAVTWWLGQLVRELLVLRRERRAALRSRAG